MKIEDIQKLWEKHAELDESELSKEATKVPTLHNIFSKILLDESLILRHLEEKYKRLYRTRWEFYSGKPPLQDPDDKQPEINNLKILRADVDIYLDSDIDLSDLRLKIECQKEKCKYLESILKNIHNRGFFIRCSIDFLKFQNGL